MFYHNINPVITTIFGFEIRYYGLFYIIGFIIAYFLLNYLVKIKHIKLTKDDILDYLLYLGFGMIIGSRVIYFLVYNPAQVFNDPLIFFKVWHGGMSFHGGFIGAIIAGYIFAKKKKVNYYDLADITVIPLTLALFLGRIGNFINGELYGRKYNGFFCVDYSKNNYINGPQDCRYPSQLFESIKNILIFVPLFYLSIKKKMKKGIIFWLFITLYGLFRFFIEFVRQPDSHLGDEGFIFHILNIGISMGQILCFFMIISGLSMIYYISKKKQKNNVI
jgi:phosphatidylglycerol---prolipoprotein diacylglyceryl transferase